ncbi:hypothetical protein AB0N60_12890 [Streptomyces microflavus]|uniref:hypothetical protein n=1 Tax=Streptomyces microflavus TaxID=1919 RepID=UPI00343812A9
MARFEKPRPKRSDYWQGGLGNRRTFNQDAYDRDVRGWESEKESFYADQQREREARRSKGGGNRARSAVQGAGVALGMAFTGAQAYDEPTQNSTNTQGNYADSEASNRRNNQARGQRQQTTYKGRQRGGSGQNGG